jgi:phage tail-like protein
MQLRQDPAGGHRFALEIDGVEVAHFHGCSGLRTRSDVFEIEEGGVHGYVHRRTTAAGWENVTLRLATNVSHGLLDWRERCRAGDTRQRSSGAITIYDADGSPVERFHLTGLWPVRWQGPALASTGSELAVEEIELAFEDLAVG